MKTLVIVEHDNNQIKQATLNTVSAAKALNQACDVLVMGYQCQTLIEQASKISGINAVIAVDDSVHQQPLAEAQAQVIVDIASDYDAFLAPATTYGKNLMPRVAAFLDVCQITDVSKIIDANVFDHPIYAGNAIETVEVVDDKRVLLIRPTAFDLTSYQDEPCQVITKSVVITPCLTQFIKREISQSERPELTEASVIVSGGRGLQSGEKFALIEELADCLGAAVGASRAAVDAGFVPNDYQIGQTGKVVAPNLYIAVGISGAVQHLAGMKDSRVIVAINKDEDAPIFQIATYALVGDLFEIVPQLIEQLRGR